MGTGPRGARSKPGFVPEVTRSLPASCGPARPAAFPLQEDEYRRSDLRWDHSRGPESPVALGRPGSVFGQAGRSRPSPTAPLAVPTAPGTFIACSAGVGRSRSQSQVPARSLRCRSSCYPGAGVSRPIGQLGGGGGRGDSAVPWTAVPGDQSSDTMDRPSFHRVLPLTSAGAEDTVTI
uniref:Uncharacterized protein n=1 Tax=Pipistrellus kuhlii TaxID=59472 RepID=A0A7J7ZJE6_PIPKU|nr:hypothetical protein mPipKuh1_009616 [Pipistrellus kuhlii]